MLDQLVASGAVLDAIVLSGDLADRGEAGAYRRLRSIVEPAADRLGARIVWAAGNHDDRATFRSLLLDGGGIGTPGVTDVEPAAPIHGAIRLGDLRVIVLDTSVPSHHHGELDVDQLAWLEHELATPAPDGSIIVMHHAPLPAVLDLAATVELRDQKALADVLRGSDVRSILGGHVHYSSSGTFAGIPVSTATSTAYTQDLSVEVGGTRGRDGAHGFSLVYVYDDTVLHSVVPAGDFPTVGEFVSPEKARERLAAAGILRD